MDQRYSNSDEPDVIESLISGAGAAVRVGPSVSAESAGPSRGLFPGKSQDQEALKGGDQRPTDVPLIHAAEDISSLIRQVLAAQEWPSESPQHAAERQRVLERVRIELDEKIGQRILELARVNEELKQSFGQHESEEHGLRQMVKASADIIQAIPCGLLLFQYQPPGELFFLNCNTEAKRLIGLAGDECRGVELEEIWPHASRHGLTDAFLTTAQTGDPFETDKAHFRRGRIERILKLRALSLPGNRLGVAVEDVTDRMLAEQELRRSKDETAEPREARIGTLTSEKKLLEEEVARLKASEEGSFAAVRSLAQEELAGAAARCLEPLVNTLEEAALRVSSRLDAGYVSLVRASLQEIQRSVPEVSELVKRLRQFSRVPPNPVALERRVLDLGDAVREGLDAFRKGTAATRGSEGKEWPQHLELSEGCFVTGEQSEIVDVVTVLLRNAAEASAEGGIITVKTLCGDEAVVLEVGNEGASIPESCVARVFEPFWTSKPSHPGMGLAAAAGIISRYGGSMDVIALVEQGTRFMVRLPRAEKPEE
jgi:two-component system, sensor histidine kinase